MLPSSLARYFLSLAQRRVSLAVTTAVLYSIPPLTLSVAVLWLASPMVAWSLFPLGIAMSTTGTLLLLAIWRYREAYLVDKIAPLHTLAPPPLETVTPPTDNQEKILQFQHDLEESRQERIRSTRELDLKSETIVRLTHELELYKHTLDIERDKCRRDAQTLLDQLQQHKNLLEEYQNEIAQQRQELSSREQTIVDLENKVRDLTFQLCDQKYELQTLLKLSELPIQEFPPHLSTSISEAIKPNEECIRTPGEALLLLKRCLDAARKITAPSYYTALHAPFGHVAPTSHPLDLRRLCDSLRAERGAGILLYSLQEEKVLFATPIIESITGWSADQWTHDAHRLLGHSLPEWSSATHRLVTQGEMLLNLVLINSDVPEGHCHAYLGTIPSGLFRHYVIAVFFPSVPLN